MRILSYTLFALAIVAAGLAIWLYLWAMGMACAYVTRPGCSIKPPWRLGYEDLLYLVAIPWGVVLLLAIGGIAARRSADKRRPAPGSPSPN
ncbi:MAG: hypothetical protein WDZ83_13010 [Rhizobiaceae bacterium]